MKRKLLIGIISILALIALIQISGQMLVKLGMRPFYIQSDGKSFKLVRGPVDPRSFPALKPGNAGMKKKGAVPVIIDTDMAGDDWMAILYLLQHPDINVVAITVTGAGEAHCSPGIRHALDLLILAGHPEVPVTCGRELPLAGNHAFPVEWRNRVDNLFDLSLPRNLNFPSEESAPELISHLLQDSDQKIHIVALGPLTNIAQAIEANPSLNDNLRMLTIMGGAVNVPGNVGPTLKIENQYAEWNIYADPYAARIVFERVRPITLVPLDATRHAPMTIGFYRQIESDRNTPVAEFVYRILTQMEDRIQQGGYYFWDPLSAAIATDPTLAKFQNMKLVVVDEESLDCGRTTESKDGQTIRVATWANAARFEKLFLDTLNGRLP